MKHVMGKKSKTKLTNVVDSDVQPNAVDLRLGKVFRILENDFIISEDQKSHRGTLEIHPSNGWYQLVPGHYEVTMENLISVGENEAGWVITRSTLNRNGVFLTSGLYDTGYEGTMAGVMHVTIGAIRIKQGTRIGQYLSFDAEALHHYDGSYGFDENGKPKQDEAKYHG